MRQFNLPLNLAGKLTGELCTKTASLLKLDGVINKNIRVHEIMFHSFEQS